MFMLKYHQIRKTPIKEIKYTAITLNITAQTLKFFKQKWTFKNNLIGQNIIKEHIPPLYYTHCIINMYI